MDIESVENVEFAADSSDKELLRTMDEYEQKIDCEVEFDENFHSQK